RGAEPGRARGGVVTVAGMVDWGLAGRIASAVAGDGDGAASAEFGQSAVERACEKALPAVLAYSRLEPAEELPRPEAVGSGGWSRTGLATMRELSVQLEERIAAGLNGAGALSGGARTLAGGAA